MSNENVQSSRMQLRRSSRDAAESIMKLAGFEIRHVWELANGYWPDAPDYDTVRTPWWLFLTDIGLVQLGRRKRVLEIRWDTCHVRAVVTTDDVTKSDVYVHAYSSEDAITYLRELRRRAELTCVPLSTVIGDTGGYATR